MLDRLQAWANENDGWIGLLSLCVALVALVQIWQTSAARRRDDLRIKLSDLPWREAEVARLSCTRAERYFAFVQALLNWAERIWGPRLEIKAFERCVQLALIYPVIGVALAWLIAGQTHIGSLEIFPEVPHWAGRLWRLAVLCLVVALVAWIFANLDKWLTKAGLKTERWLDKVPNRPGFLPKAGRLGMELLVFSAGVVVSLVGVYGVGVVGFGTAVGVAVTLAGLLIYGAVVHGVASISLAIVVFSVGGVVILSFGVGVGFQINFGSVDYVFHTENSILFNFFFLLLPVVNAFADFASLAITRWFLQDALNHRYGRGGLVWYMLWDFACGLACLIGLLALLTGALTVWGWVSPATLPVDWLAYWRAAQADWRDGTALWALCLTTLLPTFVHVGWAIVFWFRCQSGHTQNAVTAMQQMNRDAALGEAASPAEIIETADLLIKGRRAGLVKGGALAVPLAALIYVAVIEVLIHLPF